MNNFFTLTDHKCIDERVHRFGVHGGMSTGDDDGVSLVTVNRADGDSGQIQHIEGVGVESLVGEGKADDIEACQGLF